MLSPNTCIYKPCLQLRPFIAVLRNKFQISECIRFSRSFKVYSFLYLIMQEVIYLSQNFTSSREIIA